MFLLQRQRLAAKNGAPEQAASSSSIPLHGTTLHDLPTLTDEEKAALASTAQALATRGKGILAADESTPTVRRRWVRRQIYIHTWYIRLLLIRGLLKTRDNIDSSSACWLYSV